MDSRILLVDTNVWFDLFDPARGRHTSACALVEGAQKHAVSLAFAVSSLKDVYYGLSMMLKRSVRASKGALSESEAKGAEATAWACVQSIQEIATPVAVDLTDVWLAGKYRHQLRDFEDALIAAAATRCHADVLVTNDERFLRHCPVCAMDAADALTYIEAMES